MIHQTRIIKHQKNIFFCLRIYQSQSILYIFHPINRIPLVLAQLVGDLLFPFRPIRSYTIYFTFEIFQSSSLNLFHYNLYTKKITEEEVFVNIGYDTNPERGHHKKTTYKCLASFPNLELHTISPKMRRTSNPLLVPMLITSHFLNRSSHPSFCPSLDQNNRPKLSFFLLTSIPKSLLLFSRKITMILVHISFSFS